MGLKSGIIEDYKKNGVVKLENFFSRSAINKLLDEYQDKYKSDCGDEIYLDSPLVVLWTHVIGGQKKTCRLADLPSFESLITEKLVPYLIEFIPSCYPDIKQKRIQLLETIVFNKPPKTSNTLNWHQDVAYFPLKPNNQIAVWFPLSDVSSDVGTMVYALGTHKLGMRGSTNLHTREPFKGEDRDLIPDDPRAKGITVKEYEMTQKDLLIHDGLTWHYSKPNISANTPRMGVSVRFIIEESCYDPRPGQGAAFVRQLNTKPGEIVKSSCFPVYWQESVA